MAEPHRYPVVVSNGHETYYGTLWYEYPVDIPPLVEANGRRCYIDVWTRAGWTVEDDDA